MRIRLVWFTIGFTSASAAMSQFIFRDLWAHQLSLSSQVFFSTFIIIIVFVKNFSMFDLGFQFFHHFF